MSRINDLIKELCPRGVRKYVIKDICDVTRGRVISKTELSENTGDYPVYSSQTLNNGVFGKINTYDFEGEYVQWTTDGANAGSIFYRNGKFSVTNVCGLLKIKEEYSNKIMTSYLALALTMESKKYVNYATSNPKLMSNVMEKITVLIPPLEVQEEIVRILDKFGELEAKLEAELEAELEARRSQYEFWRDKMFIEEASNGLVEFSKFATIQRGGNFQKKDYVDDGKPCIHYGQIYMNYGLFTDSVISFINEDVFSKQRVAHKNDIIMAVTSENMEDVCKAIAWLGDEDVAVSGHSAIISHNQNPKYLSYFFQSKLFQTQKLKYARGVKVIEFQPDKLNKIEIPLPSLERQNEIVSKLDKMYSLINSFEYGLPAEIEARRKQYEYYRNKLLSFEEVSYE